MRKLLCLMIISLSFQAAFTQNNIPSAEVQIKTALLAAPENKRDSATVYGFNANGDMVILKQGANELICVADDPKQPEFSVACYHKDLHAFMQRGRELRKLGKSHQEVFDIREKEAKSGELILPKQPTSLYVLTAKDADYNKTTGEVKNTYLRSVVYIPYATAESTGLPLKPAAPGMPWIMHPGTHGAHIMINPPATAKN
ncbi:MAG: hypothetical protein JNK79_08655 [Chitinophagaceae bacterium]|nr:hypothetical protein [Chitinophagaceae bacterium]